MIALVGKNSIPISLSNGTLCSVFNDFVINTDALYKKGSRTIVSLVTDKTKKYRCLQYQLYDRGFSKTADIKMAVPCLYDSNVQEDGSFLAKPLYECISPIATPIQNTNSVNVVFWTNLKSGVLSFEKDTDGQYIYDESKILKIEHDKMSDFDLSGSITRVLCSTTIHFASYSSTHSLTSTPVVFAETLIPIASKPVILEHVISDSPVLDFGAGGNGGGFKNHNHSDNLNGGFSYAVYAPGTSLNPINWS